MQIAADFYIALVRAKGVLVQPETETTLADMVTVINDYDGGFAGYEVHGFLHFEGGKALPADAEVARAWIKQAKSLDDVPQFIWDHASEELEEARVDLIAERTEQRRAMADYRQAVL